MTKPENRLRHDESSDPPLVNFHDPDSSSVESFNEPLDRGNFSHRSLKERHGTPDVIIMSNPVLEAPVLFWRGILLQYKECSISTAMKIRTSTVLLWCGILLQCKDLNVATPLSNTTDKSCFEMSESGILERRIPTKDVSNMRTMFFSDSSSKHTSGPTDGAYRWRKRWVQ